MVRWIVSAWIDEDSPFGLDDYLNGCHWLRPFALDREDRSLRSVACGAASVVVQPLQRQPRVMVGAGTPLKVCRRRLGSEVVDRKVRGDADRRFAVRALTAKRLVQRFLCRPDKAILDLLDWVATLLSQRGLQLEIVPVQFVSALVEQRVRVWGEGVPIDPYHALPFASTSLSKGIRPASSEKSSSKK